MSFQPGWSGGRPTSAPATVERGAFSNVNYFTTPAPAWASWTFDVIAKLDTFAATHYLFSTIDAAVTVQGVGMFVNPNGLGVVALTSSGVETFPAFTPPFPLLATDVGRVIKVTITYDGAHTIDLYVNDGYAGTLTLVGTIAPLSGTMTIGADAGLTVPWNGTIVSVRGTGSALTYPQIASDARTVTARTSHLIVPTLPSGTTWVAANGTIDASVTAHGAVTSAAAAITWVRYFVAVVFGDSTDLGANALAGGYPWAMRQAYVADGTHYAFRGNVALHLDVSGWCFGSTLIDDFLNAGAHPVVPQVTGFRPAVVVFGPMYNDLRTGPVSPATVAARVIALMTEILTAYPGVRFLLKYCLTSDLGDPAGWPTSDYAAYVAGTAAWNAARSTVQAYFGAGVVELAPAYTAQPVYSDFVHPVDGPTGYDIVAASMLEAAKAVLPAT